MAAKIQRLLAGLHPHAWSSHPMPPHVLGSNGLTVPADFPGPGHDEVRQLVDAALKGLGADPRIRIQFYLGWNAVADRYLSTCEYGEEFANSLDRYGAAPAQPHRHEQERAFFGFVVSGLACLEAAAYSSYALAAASDPGSFPFVRPGNRRGVSIEATRDRLRRTQPGQPLTAALITLCDSTRYAEWGQIRNVLVHRGLPGRLMSMTNAVVQGTEYQPFEDVAGVAVNRTTVNQYRAQLAQAVTSLVDGLKTFARLVTP
jgi:hypothetical protein